MPKEELAKELAKETIEEVKEFLHSRADALELKSTHRSIERSIKKILQEHASEKEGGVKEQRLTAKAKSTIRKVLAEAFFVGVDEGKYSEWDGISTGGLGPDDIPCETIDPLLNKIVMHLENERR